MSRSRFKCPDADYVIQWKGVGFPPKHLDGILLLFRITADKQTFCADWAQ